MNKNLLHSVRNAFISGLLVLAPLAVTVWVFTKILDAIGGTFSPLLFPYLPAALRNDQLLRIVWNVLATVIILALITGLGYLSRYVLGQYFGGLAERFIQSIPGVNTVYNTVKQIVDTFSTQHRSLFTKVVLVEFPRPGVRTIGFLTPNPTSGFLLLLPKTEIIELEMSVGEGMKLLISGGTVVPPAAGGGSRGPGAASSRSPTDGAKERARA